MIPKFRAWDKESKEMLPVRGVSFYPPVVRCQVMDYEEGRVSETNLALYDIELMQSTGLKDKNGVEIFEGDIVLENGMQRTVTFGEQEYEENFGDLAYYIGFNVYTKWGYATLSSVEYEVIGNIYENPELLEVEG